MQANWLDRPAIRLRLQSIINRRSSSKSQLFQHRDKRLKAVPAIIFDIDIVVAEKTLPRSKADAPFIHIALNDRGCCIAVAAERLGKIVAGVIQDIAAAPVNKFKHAKPCEAKCKTIFNGFVDLFSA